jgi:hypothetical protein
MHVYQGGKTDEGEPARRAVAEETGALPPPMAPMPKTSFEDLRRLTRWEADMRHDAKGLNVTNYRDHILRCRDSCQPYWVQLGLPLLAHALFKERRVNLGMRVLEEVEEPLRQMLLRRPLPSGPALRGLEEDPVLLESRRNLLHYAAEAHVVDDRRESLWREYYEEYSMGTPEESERRREVPVSNEGWARRDRESGQPELFRE